MNYYESEQTTCFQMRHEKGFGALGFINKREGVKNLWKFNSVTKHKSQFNMSLLFNNLIQTSSTNNSYETIYWPKVPLCTSLVSHNFVWGTLYCSCMHFYASSSHSIMSLSIKMQGNIKTSGICLWDPLKKASYTIQLFD